MQQQLTGSVVVASGKGGAGKTTTAMAIGRGLQQLGASPIMIDADYGGSMTRSYGYDPAQPLLEAVFQGRLSLEESLHPTDDDVALVPGHVGLAQVPRSSFQSWRDHFSRLSSERLLVVDTSDDIVSTPVSAAISTADILVVPTRLALKDYKRTIPEIAAILEATNHRPEILWIATMVDTRAASPRKILRTIAEDGIKLEGMIPKGIAADDADFELRSVVGALPKSRVAVAYMDLARSVYALLRRLRGFAGKPSSELKAPREIPV